MNAEILTLPAAARRTPPRAIYVVWVDSKGREIGTKTFKIQAPAEHRALVVVDISGKLKR